MWIFIAILSAFFAGLTAILSKIGVKEVESNLATAIRTSVVLVFAWIIAFITREYTGIVNISAKSWIFLVLSGLATGFSWVCYLKALSMEEVSKVSAVDKTSTVMSVLFAIILFADERNYWWVKLILLAIISVGTFLMIDIKKSENKESKKWLIFAFLSALFASLTSILAKIGIEIVASNLATAVRTSVVFVMAWLIPLFTKEVKEIKNVKRKELISLILSGLATGASWLCYYYAIKEGQVSVVVPIDKMSVLLTVLFSVFILKEKVKLKGWIGLGLITPATIVMALIPYIFPPV